MPLLAILYPGEGQYLKKRYYELDSLRGLAAITVVIHHCLLVAWPLPMTWPAWLVTRTPFGVIEAGHQAVMLFFVLSGFVLTIPFLSNTVPYRQFMAKRICRIYVAYYGALALSILLLKLFSRYGIPSLNGWFNLTWTQHITLPDVLQHVLLIGKFNSAVYNTAFWSLIHEMRISIVFPLIAILIKRKRWTTALLIAGILSLIGQSHHLITVHYAAFFIIGGILAKHRTELVGYFSGLTQRSKWLVVCIALCLYSARYWVPGQLQHKLSYQAAIFVFDWGACLGSALFILIALSFGSVTRILVWTPVHFLGKISYSIYLTHASILFALVYLLYDKVPIWVIWCLTLVITLGVSTLSYYALELPSVRWGQALARRLSGPQPPKSASSTVS